MQILFVGGTGLISSASSSLAVERGHDLTLLTRGGSSVAFPPEGAQVIRADARDPEALRSALRGRRLRGEKFDAVVQWIGFTPDHIAEDMETFHELTDQYVYISSASAYQKPPEHYLVREGVTPLDNPHWQYSRDKIASEQVIRDSGLPFTIVRPSLTYGYSQFPVCIGSWDKPWTIVDRMRRGAPILIPGDGTSLWVNTHHRDFAVGLVGLLGNPAAMNEDFHITSDEVLTWNQIYAAVADAAGIPPRTFAQQVVHVPTDAFIAADREQFEGSLWGDKVHSTVFDNSKIKAAVPDFDAKIPFAEGIRETVAWFEADESRRGIDDEANDLWDRIAAAQQAAAS